MLLRESFAGSNEQDIVQRFVVIVQKLPVIEVHENCLSAAGCHPEGEFCHIRRAEIRVLRKPGRSLGNSCFNKILQVFSQLFLMVEIPVQKKLCQEKGRTLEIAKRQ